MNTKYSRPSLSFHLKPLKADVIDQVEAHNSRLAHVPHAHHGGTAEVRFLAGDTLHNAIATVAEQLGANPAADGSNVAAEAVFGFPAGMKNPPKPEVFCEAIERLSHQTFPGLIAGIWLHVDESSPHVHVVLVPICEAPTRGRRPKGKAKPPQKCVSYFRFTHTHERRPGRRGPGEPPRNLYLAGLHDKFAAGVAHLGLKRGLPSARPHLPIKRIHAAQEDLLAVVGRAFDELPDVASGLVDDLANFVVQDVPHDQLVEHFMRQLVACFQVIATPLQEIALRGISLESERRARYELSLHYERVVRENALLKGQLQQHGVAPQLPVFDVVEERSDDGDTMAKLPHPRSLKQALAASAAEHGKPARARPLPTPTTPPHGSGPTLKP